MQQDVILPLVPMGDSISDSISSRAARRIGQNAAQYTNSDIFDLRHLGPNSKHLRWPSLLAKFPGHIAIAQDTLQFSYNSTPNTPHHLSHSVQPSR